MECIMADKTKKTELPPEAEKVLSDVRERERQSQADKLIELAKKEKVALFRDPDGASYADVMVRDHRETWLLRSSGFRKWLRGKYYLRFKSAPNKDALDTAVETLDAQAQFECETVREVWLRVAYHGGKIYYDLCNDDWEVVEISAAGWTITKDAPVRFRRMPSSRPQVVPVEGGNLYALRNFLNLKKRSDWVLLISAILKFFYIPGAHPIIELCGEAGTAKTSTERIVVALVDPSAGRERNPPREEGDLIAAARNGYLIPYDNFSHLSDWLSDALSRLSTGSGLSRRTLYTNTEETTFYAKRGLVLTGINPVALKGDIDQRKVRIWLKEIEPSKRQAEEAFEAAFEEARPQLFGALLSALVIGLQNLSTAKTTKDLPRMADYAVWGTACEPAYANQGDLMKVLAIAKGEAAEEVLEHSVAAQALIAALDKRSNSEWTTTAGALYAQLRAIAGELEIWRSDRWPTDGQRLLGELNTVAPQLREAGITITREKREGKARSRLIKITPTHRSVFQRPQRPPDEFDESFNDLGRPLPASASVRPASADAAASASVRRSVRHNQLKNKEETAADAETAKIPTLGWGDVSPPAHSSNGAQRRTEKPQQNAEKLQADNSAASRNGKAAPEDRRAPGLHSNGHGNRQPSITDEQRAQLRREHDQREVEEGEDAADLWLYDALEALGVSAKQMQRELRQVFNPPDRRPALGPPDDSLDDL
jgi:hypothetical protein